MLQACDRAAEDAGDQGHADRHAADEYGNPRRGEVRGGHMKQMRHRRGQAARQHDRKDAAR